jgi:hypothetical protein
MSRGKGSVPQPGDASASSCGPPHESLQAEAICGCLEHRTRYHNLWLLIFVDVFFYLIVSCLSKIKVVHIKFNPFFGNLDELWGSQHSDPEQIHQILLWDLSWFARPAIFFLTMGWCQPQHFGISWPHPRAWFWDCPGHEGPRWQAYSHTAPSHLRILGRTSTNPYTDLKPKEFQWAWCHMMSIHVPSMSYFRVNREIKKITLPNSNSKDPAC